jgi:hypothetical protein
MAWRHLPSSTGVDGVGAAALVFLPLGGVTTAAAAAERLRLFVGVMAAVTRREDMLSFERNVGRRIRDSSRARGGRVSKKRR